jgi:hypothetical protein
MHLSSIPRRIALLAAAVALAVPLVSPTAVFAQAAPADDAASDAVARVSLISGSVAVQRGDTTDPTAAVINAPILAGDYLTTGDGSRAEIEIDGGTIVRLGDNVQLRFTHLENDTRAIQLAEGTIELRLLRGTDGTSNVDTPSISVRPRSSGSYRVSVTSDGQTLVTVRSGDAEIIGPQGSQSVVPGTTIVAQGPSSDPSIVSQAELQQDAFDQFNTERDARYEQAVADTPNVPNVDPNVTGVQDLDAYGQWVSDPSYGQVWTPSNVAADWAPYRDGNWVWEGNFGWTWIGAEPWGWAPYHYGSWYRNPTYGWCWFPPRPGPVAVWRPALVAFVAFGGGGSAGFGYAGSGFGANIGWVPLAPYEPWRPWWGNHWGTTVGSIHNTYINNGTFLHNYRNAQYGVTAVPGQRFTEGNFRHPMVVAPGELGNVQAIRGAVPIVPTSANLRYSSANVEGRLAVHPSFGQQAFAGSTEPVRRVPFEQQRSAFATATRLPLTPESHGFAGNGPVNGATRGNFREGSAPAGNGPANDAWSRFGQNRGIDAPRNGGTAYGASPYVDRPARGTGNAPRTTTAPQRIDVNPRYSSGGYQTYRGSDVRAAPTRSYASPRTYDAPTRNNYASPRSYNNAPSRTYSAPSRTYSAPSRTYGAPSRSYNAPSRTYHAPARGATGSAPRASGHRDEQHH